jgi:flagellar hook protein FlgE
VFDSLGNAHVLQTFYVKTAPGAWDVYAAADEAIINGGVAIGSLAFGTDGALTAASQASLPLTASIPVTTGAADPLAVGIDFSGTSQFGSSFSVNQLDQDGYTSGRLSGFGVAPDGLLMGRYTNGKSAVLGQVVLASFANNNGLQPLGSNLWSETAESGSPMVGAPTSGNLGALQSNAVEDSNVDLTAELVNMITAQRNYQANAQTIKTQDQVLQTLVNLR